MSTCLLEKHLTTPESFSMNVCYSFTQKRVFIELETRTVYNRDKHTVSVLLSRRQMLVERYFQNKIYSTCIGGNIPN